VDVLSDVLTVARVSGALMATFDARAPWAIELPERAGASFHAVIAGACWFTVGGQAPRQLTPGDLVLLPSGARHELAAEPGLPPRRFDEDLKASLITPDGELVIDGPGVRTRVLCAGYSYDNDVAHPLLSLLPPVLHVATAQPDTGPQLRAVLDLLAHEAHGGADIGAQTTTVKLLDILLVQVVRAWLRASHGDAPADRAQGGGLQASWLRGLRDPVTAQALALLHERPGHDWTLQDLAGAVHVSRATLARRFTQHIGEPPHSYLTRWRMELAARQLRDSTQPAAQVARSVGYSSEYAFNRAFTKHRGTPPGRYRRDHHGPAGGYSQNIDSDREKFISH
jgi:AraC-like DNA-binding protein